MTRTSFFFCFLFFGGVVSSFSVNTDPNLVMKLQPQKKNSDQDHYYAWKINLDNDSANEYVVASGYEDGVDYSVYRDPKEEDSLIFRFNPVLIDDSNKSKPFYWGYPWDIENIIVKRDGSQIKILCSFDHQITRDGEIDIPEWQTVLPALFFTGKSTQPNISVGEIKEQLWLTLEQIEKKVRAAYESP